MATTLEEIDAISYKTWLTTESINASLNNVSLLYTLQQEGRLMLKDFSAGVKVPINFAKKQVKATDGSGTGMTVHNEQATYAAEVAWKTIPAKVIITKDLLDLRQSKEEVVMGVVGQMVTAQSSIMNTVEGMIYGDGTGDGGKALDGLGIAVSKTPTVGAYANLDPAVLKQWRNFSANALDAASGLPNNGSATSPSNILNIARYVTNKLAINGKSINRIVVGTRYYNMFDEAIGSQQRIITQNGVAKSGFRTLMLNDNVMIINAGGLKRDGDLNPTYTGLDDNTMYFLSVDDMFLFYNRPQDIMSQAKSLGIKSSDINAVVYPACDNGMILQKDIDTLDYFIMMVFKGNLILGDRQIHGVVYEEVVAP